MIVSISSGQLHWYFDIYTGTEVSNDIIIVRDIVSESFRRSSGLKNSHEDNPRFKFYQ